MYDFWSVLHFFVPRLVCCEEPNNSNNISWNFTVFDMVFLKVIYYVLKTPVDLAKIVKKSELANSLINAITDLKIKSENAGEDQLNAWINDCNSVIEKFFGKDSYVHKVFNEKIIDNGLQTKLILHLQQKMLTGGKRLTRNISLVNDDKFAFKLICLDWIIEPFLPYTIPIRPVSGKK